MNVLKFNRYNTLSLNILLLVVIIIVIIVLSQEANRNNNNIRRIICVLLKFNQNIIFAAETTDSVQFVLSLLNACFWFLVQYNLVPKTCIDSRDKYVRGMKYVLICSSQLSKTFPAVAYLFYKIYTTYASD